MKKPIRSCLVLLVLAAACAKPSQSQKTANSASVEPTPRSTAQRGSPAAVEVTRGEGEVLTPASGTRLPRDADDSRPIWGAETQENGAAQSGAATAESGAAPAEPAERQPDVIYVPTPQPIVDKMLELAKVTPNDVVYDLGCGDGRIVVTAAKKYKAKAFGFDIDPKRIAEARANVAKNNVGDLVTIEQRDIFKLDLSPATVVTLYLLPSLNNRLKPQLEQLASGSRIVSHDYDIAGVIPVEHLAMRPAAGEREHQIYFWTVPFQYKQTLPQPSVPVGPRAVP